MIRSSVFFPKSTSAALEPVTGAANLGFAMSALVSKAQHRVDDKNGVHDRAAKQAQVRAMPSPPQSSKLKSTVFKDGQAVHGGLVRVGLLEDSPIEAEGITRLFEENGFKVVRRSSGMDFLKLLELESFDLLVLDWNVPDLSGIEVLYTVRDSMQIATPVLMLTSRSSEYDVVQALNRGADDYLQKPWKPFELIARMNALLRRLNIAKLQQDEHYSEFFLEQKLMQVSYRDRVVKLSQKEFLLFQLLIRHMGSPVSRAHIMQSVWNGDKLEDRTLDVHISRLRNKLDLNMRNGFSLASIYGYGYRLEKLADAKNKI